MRGDDAGAATTLDVETAFAPPADDPHAPGPLPQSFVRFASSLPWRLGDDLPGTAAAFAAMTLARRGRRP